MSHVVDPAQHVRLGMPRTCVLPVRHLRNGVSGALHYLYVSVRHDDVPLQVLSSELPSVLPFQILPHVRRSKWIMYLCR